MTDRPQDASDARLDAWMQARVERAMTPADDAIPREAMWARVAAAPRLVDRDVTAVPVANALADVARVTAPSAITAPQAARPARAPWTVPLLIAAGLLVGVGIGRFGWPTASSSDSAVPGANRVPTVAAAPTTAVVSPDTASRTAPPPASAAVAPVAATRLAAPISPVVVVHLQRTVDVLAVVRDAEHVADGDSATRQQLQQLLVTTRELLDDPSLRQARTHRLLQDLELVLAQLSRARATAPATRAAADEALRETNLLPRLRAAANDGRSGSEDR
jgi:hypothetical protein